MFCTNDLVVFGLMCSALEDENKKWIELGGGGHVVVDRVPASVGISGFKSQHQK